MSLDATPNSDASIGDLVAQLSSQTSRLVRDEMRLAQKELQQSVRHAGIGAGLFGAAGLLAFFGFASVITAAIAALALALPIWAAALIVGGALFLAAGVAALMSRRQAKEVTPAAPETVASVKKDIEEVKGARRERS
ncbi:phage holin family protein [Mycobacterium bourgelatii]|uniref:Membrane protein n=1 Tax=Mycobacterium bourgelatii TaxID=1273442 RepID=A0A7I9YSV4_MYCBU|nr:phage holin family protein [Mycobacterium bourgelatii]MCV6973359.1 phage holin family protein [Mycobacterium bourgelatii]GFG91768.1 membrane protein [Mycobacterium bourgelatii]